MAEDEKNKKIRSSSSTQPEISASPPRFVSLEELMSAAKGMTQMSLAHEITLDKDFKLEREDHSSNSIEKLVKETVHKAFWDILENELKESPPKYSQALVLLAEVKENLFDLLLPQHSRIRQQIDENLDMERIRLQAENGTLHEEYLAYAQFVISIMAKMCAPVRDEKIAELTATTEVLPLFRGILDLLTLMRVDMANFTIDIMRPQIVANSVAYEKKKFNDFLKVNPDGLNKTKDWLLKNISSANDESHDLSKKIENVINSAYVNLLENETSLLPETFTMDESRLKNISNELRRLTTVGAILLIVFSHAGPNIASIAKWKQAVKDAVLTLISADSSDLDGVAVKMKSDIVGAAQKYDVPGHSVDGLEESIKSVKDKNHKIINLLNVRIKEFILLAITSRTAERLRVPPGLSILQEELTQLTGNFLRVVSHNRQIFGEHYVRILTEHFSMD